LNRVSTKTNEVEVSIVIVSWNTRDILRNCISSIYDQTVNISFEVIVVDNASCDNSSSMVKDKFSQVIPVENQENKGFAAANNQGIAVAKGHYILLLNSDTLILGNAIHQTVKFADAHPEAAVVGCKVLNPDKTLQQTCFMFPSLSNMLLSSTYLYKLFPRSKFFGRERMSWWDRNDVREVDVVTGCFMLVRRRAIEQTGLLDERFFVYGEETDWCYRFKKGGWKVLFTPDAEIIHLGGQSSKRISIEMTLQLRGSILLFIKKHRSALEYRLACILVWLFFAIRVPFWLITFAVKRTDTSRNKLTAYLKGMYRLMLHGANGLCANSQ
jgi:GT2 family glycosyltransferase